MKRALGLLACLSIAACSTPGYRTLNPSCLEDKALAKYERDGHQDTTYVIAGLAGRSPREAALLSFYNQAADDVAMRFAATNVSVWGSLPGAWGYRHRINAVLHSLHGGDVAAVQARRSRLASLIASSDTSDADHVWQTGLLIHALGDSFAHTRADRTAYGELYGHLFAGHEPDYVARDRALYLDYVETLYRALETATADAEGYATFRARILAIGGPDGDDHGDVDDYRRVISASRDLVAPAPSLRCDERAGRLNMREVSAFLRTVEG